MSIDPIQNKKCVSVLDKLIFAGFVFSALLSLSLTIYMKNISVLI